MSRETEKNYKSNLCVHSVRVGVARLAIIAVINPRELGIQFLFIYFSFAPSCQPEPPSAPSNRISH